MSAAAGLRPRLPVYSVDPAVIPTPGCLAVVGWDPEADGAQAGALAVQVLRGRSPATMAFEPVARKLLLLNRRTARAIGVTLPPRPLTVDFEKEMYHEGEVVVGMYCLQG